MGPADVVDLERYPIDALDSPRAEAVAAAARTSLAERGVAILPDFVRADALRTMVAETRALVPKAHREDVAVGTPYLELADTSFPEGHPRRTDIHSLTDVIAYDLIPQGAAVRGLYESEAFLAFLAQVLERRPLYRFADPLGALNLAAMSEGHVQGWHFDSTDFVVSLALQSSESGGNFECATRIRSEEDENYDAVADVLQGRAPERVEILPMVPGTLMIFYGRHSLHRVSPVQGDRPRYVALFAFDTKPGTDSSDLLKLVRYGRTEALA